MDGPLDHTGPGNFDQTVLRDLLARLAPDVAAQVRDQFVADLTALRSALVTAVAAPGDGAALSREVHVLAALAGTAGDTGLAEQARAVSEQLRAGDVAGAARRAAALGPQIEALTAFVDECRLPDRPTRP